MLYVRNLRSDVTEDQLREKFEQHGKVERVKKVKDYGFIHFEDRESAVQAMQLLNGTVRYFVILSLYLSSFCLFSLLPGGFLAQR